MVEQDDSIWTWITHYVATLIIYGIMLTALGFFRIAAGLDLGHYTHLDALMWTACLFFTAILLGGLGSICSKKNLPMHFVGSLITLTIAACIAHHMIYIYIDWYEIWEVANAPFMLFRLLFGKSTPLILAATMVLGYYQGSVTCDSANRKRAGWRLALIIIGMFALACGIYYHAQAQYSRSLNEHMLLRIMPFPWWFIF